MKKTWKVIGIVAFWVTWPALWVYLHMGKRTRALIICGDEFLALKAWYGSDVFILPGGGLHRGENSLQGLIREVHEETGIELYEKDVRFLFSKTDGPVSYDAFEVRLGQKPVIRPQRGEIRDYAWLPLGNPPRRVNDDVRLVLDHWKANG